MAKFSLEGDYFISAGAEKVINLWKTGFYDSYKEKIIGNPSVGEEWRGKVKYEVKPIMRQQTSEGDEITDQNKQGSNRSEVNQRDP